MMDFPVYVMMKDSGVFYRFEAYEAINHSFEAIDIENQEYIMWDGKGRSLNYSNDNDGNLKLERSAETVIDIRAELLRQMKGENSASTGLILEHLVDSVLLRQKREDRGLLAVGRRLLERVFPTRKHK